MGETQDRWERLPELLERQYHAYPLILHGATVPTLLAAVMHHVAEHQRWHPRPAPDTCRFCNTLLHLAELLEEDWPSAEKAEAAEGSVVRGDATKAGGPPHRPQAVQPPQGPRRMASGRQGPPLAGSLRDDDWPVPQWMM